MDDLNYHHLRYFWVVAREGNVSRAAQLIGLSQPAVSSQVRALERALGTPLFRRRGRGLVLTDFGHMVQEFADQIFTVGRRLSDAVRGELTERPLRLAVGVNFGMPKLVVKRLLEPVLHMAQPIRLIVSDDRPERLLAELVMDNLDLALADAPYPQPLHARVFNHLLGETDVTIFGTSALSDRHRGRFPASLQGAPFLIPTGGTALHRSLEGWFDRHEIRPRVIAEISDTTVLREFGRAGAGFFAAPSLTRDEVSRTYEVRVVGVADGVRERYYATSLERRISHPAVVSLIENARRLFA